MPPSTRIQLLAGVVAVSLLACEWRESSPGQSSVGAARTSACDASASPSAVGPPPLPSPTPAEIALFDYDASVPVDAVERGRERRRGVTRIDLTYASPHGGRVPAWVYEPEGEGPHAGVVMMHGLPGDRNTRWRLAIGYARAGAVVITISAPFARPERQRTEPITLTEQDRAEQIQLIVDLRRAVDYLLVHPAVDPDRVGYVGASYGGAMGGLLAGVEHRIAAYALVVADGGVVTHLSGPEDLAREQVSAGRWQAWLDAMEPIEPIRYVRLAKPTALLFQNSCHDEYVRVADARAYQEAASQPKTLLWYDAGHDRTPEMIRDQVDWMARHIGIDPARFSRPGMLPDWGEIVDWLS